MKLRILLGIAGVFGATSLSAQTPLPPRPLPPSLSSGVTGTTNPFLSVSPDQRAVDRKRASEIAALKEEILMVEPGELRTKESQGKWSVVSGTRVLKTFGGNRDAAETYLLTVRDLNVSGSASIEGARPNFEYYLRDGKAPRALGRNLILPIVNRYVRAERLQETWVLTDGSKVLYEFGTDEAGCRRAETIFAKYGFNQMIVIGSPNPVAIIPARDPWQRDPEGPMPKLTQIAFAEIDRTSLSLKDGTFVGVRIAFDPKQLSVVEIAGKFALVHGEELLGRFGPQEKLAKTALQALTDAKVTEIVRIGKTGMHIYLGRGGEPLRTAPLSATTQQHFRGDRLKVQPVRDGFWLLEDGRPLLPGGSKAEAELLLNLIRQFQFSTLATFGRSDVSDTGGLRIFTLGR